MRSLDSLPPLAPAAARLVGGLFTLLVFLVLATAVCLLERLVACLQIIQFPVETGMLGLLA